MTTYGTSADALALLPTFGTLSTATVPTAAQATAYVTTVSQEVDLHLTAVGVDLPVTDTSAIAMLTTVTAYGVAALLLKARFPGDAGPGSDAGGAGFFDARYQAALKLIDGGALAATAAPETSDFGQGFTTTLDDDGADVESLPAFRRLMEF